jgi:uncharacterized membrane protein
MKKSMTMLSGLGLGAALMYISDPNKGKRRRAEARNKVTHTVNIANDAIGKTSRDIANRVTGIAAEMESLFTCSKASDDVLSARVRSELGRLVSHPHAIEVAVAEGRVTLSGQILAAEVDELIESASAIRGVTGVENRLEVHEEAGNVSSLQGGRENLGKRFAMMKTNWSPTTRLLAGATGGALALYATKRRGLIGAALAPIGLGMVSRALTNLEMKRILGLGAGRRAIEIQKTITIAAPVEEVFDFWSHQEKFPQFMSNVREVRKTGEGKYHWVVAGPAGISIEWDGEITKLVPNELIVFESLPGSAIEQAGIIHFTPISEDQTCIDIKMSYNPPAGAIGHLVAMLFGADPKKEMDGDLMRMKSFIETGRVPHDAADKRVREATTY